MAHERFDGRAATREGRTTMAIAIEHKYLVRRELWQPLTAGIPYRQGYLSSVKERAVRVRIAGEQAFLTVKGPATGLARLEFEYAIPLADATAMLDQLCEKPLIDKTRHRQEFAGRVWEIDVFHGVNVGLIVAEVEVENTRAVIQAPQWVGADVSADARYFDGNLQAHPYTTWQASHA
jgi:CYTH domain-containing protein